jgi:lipopolysaccharide/colanic/teichoic acid biosynthesis glycosyltransferase
LIKKVRFPESVYSSKEFQAVIQRECARSDRSGREFSLIVLTLNQSRWGKWNAGKVAKVVTERVRSTDEVGWIGQKRLGVVLPDTAKDRARILVQDVGSRIGKAHGDYFRIYGYPEDWPSHSPENRPDNPGNGSGSESGRGDPEFARQAEEGAPGEGVECFLDCGIPRWKRVVDILGATVCFILFFPVFVAVVALIEIVSPGPIFFRQERLGHLGKPFTMWKFRTMTTNANTEIHEEYLRSLIRSDSSMRKLDEKVDARLIPFGKFLRQLGFDELPQLINVLRGEMSLIGPRPCLEYEAKEYAGWHKRRFDALPGLSGLWQVSGKNKTTHNEMMRLDINYVRRRSSLLDLKIALMTWPALIHQALGSLSVRKGAEHVKNQ